MNLLTLAWRALTHPRWHTVPLSAARAGIPGTVVWLAFQRVFDSHTICAALSATVMSDSVSGRLPILPPSPDTGISN